MAEYIEREKVYETLNAALNETDKLNGLFSQDYIRGCRNTLGIVIDDIQKIPAADVRPERHGYWSAENQRPKSVMYCCSLCGKIAHDTPIGAAKHYVKRQCTLAYCPNCGAKMDGKDDDT